MKRFFTFMFVLLMAGTLWAQEDAGTDGNRYLIPDFDHIRKVMNDQDSPQYYPKLVQRMKNADTNLRIEDLQVLYYGRALKEDYSPYSSPKEMDEIYSLLRQSTVSQKDAERIIALSEAMAETDPSEPRAYWYQFIGHSIMMDRYGGDTLAVSKSSFQFNMALAAILSSGNGKDMSQAIYVTSTSHEYFILQMYELRFTNQSLMHEAGHSYDKMSVEENEYGVKAMYFNIDLIWKKNMSLFEDFGKMEKDRSVNELTLDLGSRFVIELEKSSKKSTVFNIVSVDPVRDTIDADDSTLFPSVIPEGQIIGYFCMAKVYSNGSNPCLICKGNIKPSILYMDTEIMYENAPGFVSTSNEGLIRMAKGVEIWNNPLRKIRISKIRTKR